MIKKIINTADYILFSIVLFTASNFYILKEATNLFWIFPLLYVVVNIFPVFVLPRTKRLRTCAKGNALLIEFLGSSALSAILFCLSFTSLLSVDNMFQNPNMWIANTLIAILLEAAVFWNGMLRVFLTSEQLGIKICVKALIYGLIPVVHLFVLNQIIRTAAYEIESDERRK